MNQRRKRRLFSTAGAKVTSTVSVALALFVLGLLAVVALVTRKVADTVRENVGFDIVLTDDATVEDALAIKREVEVMPFASRVVVHSAEESAARWREETGEDVVEVLGLNPFSAEVEVKVHAIWASADSLERIVKSYEGRERIESVTLHSDMIDAVNANIMTVFKVLGAIAAALLVISFVLINNTIRLSIYSRRFLIHTMKLVGSTGGFIRRPFLVTGVWQGVTAGVTASVLLGGLVWGLSSVETDVEGLVTLPELAAVGGGMVAGGVVICVIASVMSTNRYLRLSYDEMFR